MKNKVLKYYIVAFYFCSTLGMLAQEPGSTGDGNGGLEGADDPLPIDNYVWVMALIGLIYVFFKYKSIQTREIRAKGRF